MQYKMNMIIGQCRQKCEARKAGYECNDGFIKIVVKINCYCATALWLGGAHK